MSEIVVGVDGSPASRAALSWALAEARLRGANLRAVHALTVATPFALDAPPVLLPSLMEEAEQEAERELGDVVAEVAGDNLDVPIERSVVEGPAAERLLEAAAGADLLVVGSRGHGGFHGLLLGSVSQQCAHHAPCPVVIVRP